MRTQQSDAPRWAAMARLLEGRQAALDVLAAEVQATGAQHDASGATPADGVARIAAFFDRAVRHSPEASVALYSLGDPAILAAATAEIVAWLEEQGLLRPGMDVLDLGCGIGRIAAVLAPHCRSVLGLDVSAGMVAEARRRCAGLGNIRFEQTDGQGLDALPAGAFDLVLAIDSFPYIVQAGTADRYAGDAVQVLRPGGALAVLNLSYRDDAAQDRADAEGLGSGAWVLAGGGRGKAIYRLGWHRLRVPAVTEDGSCSLSLRERLAVRDAKGADLAQSVQSPRGTAQHLPFPSPRPSPGGRGVSKLLPLIFGCLLSSAAHAQHPHRGGELRLLARSAAGTIDPQVNYTAQYWQVFALAYDGLVAFRKVPGDRGNELVPDLADALPAPKDGLTYAFHLRPGLRFSTGAPVLASDVAASFRRIFKVVSPTADTYYGAIAGAQACLRAPDACGLEGVEADDAAGTVTIRLDRPDPEFLTRLALPHASVLPADVPPRDLGNAPLPGTGPYLIQSYDPGQGIEIVRNPHFRQWSADAQPTATPTASATTSGWRTRRRSPPS